MRTNSGEQMTPAQVREFLTGERAPRQDMASEASGGDYGLPTADEMRARLASITGAANAEASDIDARVGEAFERTPTNPRAAALGWRIIG